MPVTIVSRMEESGARTRTRRAILEAAATVLSVDPGAPLGEVARAAGVGRTTLHRYYPDRAELVEALSGLGLEQVGRAVDDAARATGDARRAVVHLCRDLFDLGDLLGVVFGPLLAGRPEWSDDNPTAGSVVDLVERGHAEGTIDPALPADWVQSLVWSVLYAAHAHHRTTGGSRHEALIVATRSLDGALRPHP